MNYMNDDKERIEDKVEAQERIEDKIEAQERIEDKIDSEWSKIYTVGNSRVDTYDVAWIMSYNVLGLIRKDLLVLPDGTLIFRGAPIYIINDTKDEEIIKLVVEL